jgi:hypothetical protein
MLPPQGQQSPVLKEQGLQGDDGGHREHRRPGAQEDGRQRRAQEVAGRPARDGEVEHLRGEDERGQDTHDRHLPLPQALSGARQRQPDADDAENPADDDDAHAEKPVRDVHGSRGWEYLTPQHGGLLSSLLKSYRGRSPKS